MQIHLNDTPLDTYPYIEVSSKTSDDGSPIMLYEQLPIYLGSFEKKHSPIDFLIVCSDLQGLVETPDGKMKLLGEHLPEFLRLLIDLELSENKKCRVGVLLCGDLYTTLEKRGGSGDVREVWKAFQREFDWVVGVSGNHDSFGTVADFEAFKDLAHIHHLDQALLEIDGLVIGGISGIIGRADKANRVDEIVYLKRLQNFISKKLDVILLHETPDFPPLALIGNPKIRETIESGNPATIFCGHCHWPQSFVTYQNGTSVMNVDSKVVILINKH